MKTACLEVTPIDLRAIRRALNVTMKEMGRRIRCYSREADNTTFCASRVSEWEKGHRPVPDYVFHAAAYVTLDAWCDARHSVKSEKIAEVDAFYGGLLSKTFGALLHLEHEVMKETAPSMVARLVEIRKIRRHRQRELEDLLGVRMGYVFAPEPGGFDEETAGEEL